jgi:hypothetical protein
MGTSYGHNQARKRAQYWTPRVGRTPQCFVTIMPLRLERVLTCSRSCRKQSPRPRLGLSSKSAGSADFH